MTSGMAHNRQRVSFHVRNKTLISTLSLFILTCVAVLALFLSPVLLGSTPAQSQTLRILFTHDMHSQELPFEILRSNNTTESVGGFARLYTALERERNAGPDVTTLTLDGGDFSMGTLFNALFQSTSPDLGLMGKMGYDATTIGNHELDYGAQGLAESLQSAIRENRKITESSANKPLVLASNIGFGKDAGSRALKQAFDDYGVKPYTIIERDGIKIGVFGLIGAEATSYIGTSNGLNFLDPITSATESVKELQDAGADVIICLSHSGTGSNMDKLNEFEDVQLAKALPEIDLIISGHSHTKLERPLIVGKTAIVSAGNYGEYLGVVDLSMRHLTTATDEASAKLGKGEKFTRYNLVPINASIESNPEISQKVDQNKQSVQLEYLDELGRTFDGVITSSEEHFTTLETIDTTYGAFGIGNLIADSFVHEVSTKIEPVSIAVANAGSIRASILKGPLTTSDLYNIASLGQGPDGSLGYPLVKFYVTGAELRDLCEVDVSVSPIMPVAQLFFSGMKYQYSMNRVLFDRVYDVQVQDTEKNWTPVESEKLYPVICSLYMGQMAGLATDATYGLISIAPRDAQGTPLTDINEAVLKDSSGKELKEWIALADYADTFGSTIPAQYYKQGDYKIDTSDDVSAVFKKPGKVTYIALAVVVSLLIIVALIVFGIRTLIRRNRVKKEAQ